MSHANGQCQFEDGTVLHFEYNGTSDVCCPRLWDKYEEMRAHWRTDTNAVHECKCEKPDEPCLLATDYGLGSCWMARACRNCMSITSGFDWCDCETRKGLPDWWR